MCDNRTQLGSLFTMAAVAILLAACSKPQPVERKKPNILLLYTDQHNKQVMGFEGHPDVITPNLDRLASESVVFDRAYCARGICVPSRTALMTGLMPRTTGILTNADRTQTMNLAVPMASILQYNGYRTYAFGKRHLKDSVDNGWDVKMDHAYRPDDDDNYVSWIEREGYIEEFAHDWAAEFGKGPRGSSMFNTEIPTADLGTRISRLPEGYTMEAFTKKQTIEAIRRQAAADEPFFIWSSFYRPHQPYTPLQKYMDMYDVSQWGEGTKAGGAIKQPSSFYEPTDHLTPLMQSQRSGGNKVWNMDKAFDDEQLWRDYIGAYYALMTEIDDHIGDILEALEEAGVEEETLVIYTSDHGDFVGNHGMVEKAAAGHNIYEDILNVPLIIRYPGKTKSGKRSDELVMQIDILPTIIDLLGLEKPDMELPLQGESLAGILLDDGALNRDFVVSEGWTQAAVIGRQHKLGIMLDPHGHRQAPDYRDFGDMFFDREEDPLELNNGIGESRYQADIEQLRKYYGEWKSKYPNTGKKEIMQENEEQISSD